MKKAQIEHTFIFIFALIVAALVLGFGVKVIFDVKDRAEFAEIAANIDDITDAAVTYYNLDEESSTIINQVFPSEVTCVCFTDLSQNAKSFDENQASTYSNKCKDRSLAVRLKSSRYNIFIASQKKYTVMDFKAISELVPLENPICIEIKNQKFEARIESK